MASESSRGWVRWTGDGVEPVDPDAGRVSHLVRKWTIPREEARRLLEVQRHGE